ncbi:unnamed protein product [Didymodactylos carnosus]|uniref:Ureidoglycolate hydrolase n=1 Tax=Didymodactylos carnosus TaxID=1234261 RepID=A0A814TSK0_9BILA|nr:unnamed protein product [Didymodactylos carnosus]CAF3928923.1 unnamed protein product [Didymodactylos carnosus]
MATKTIETMMLTTDSFRAYGQVIEAIDNTGLTETANQNTAQRFNYVAQLSNYRCQDQQAYNYHHQLSNTALVEPPAKSNLCLFRVQPTPILPFEIKLLERHKYSSQMFVPMKSKSNGYLVIVCLNDEQNDRPNLNTLKAFIATSNQGINYNANVWHHPMVGLEYPTDFVCLVWERRELSTENDEDCQVVQLENIISVNVSSEYCSKI